MSKVISSSSLKDEVPSLCILVILSVLQLFVRLVIILKIISFQIVIIYKERAACGNDSLGSV